MIKEFCPTPELTAALLHQTLQSILLWKKDLLKGNRAIYLCTDQLGSFPHVCITQMIFALVI